MADSKVWLLTFMFFTFGLASYGIIFWLPQIIRQLSGVSATTVGFITALPWIAAIIVMTWVGRSSDHFGERHLHFAGACLVGAVGPAGSVLAIGPAGQLLFIGLGAVGIWSALGVFWTIPQQMYGGSAAAGVLALINAVGNLGGFVGPYMMGWARARTGAFATGLIGLSIVLLAGAWRRWF